MHEYGQILMVAGALVAVGAVIGMLIRFAMGKPLSPQPKRESLPTKTATKLLIVLVGVLALVLVLVYFAWPR